MSNSHSPNARFYSHSQKNVWHSKKCPIRIRKMHNFILIRKEMFGIGKNVQLAFAKCNLHDFSKRTSQLSSQILLTRQ